jgi:hypothetical protein
LLPVRVGAKQDPRHVFVDRSDRPADLVVRFDGRLLRRRDGDEIGERLITRRGARGRALASRCGFVVASAACNGRCREQGENAAESTPRRHGEGHNTARVIASMRTMDRTPKSSACVMSPSVNACDVEQLDAHAAVEHLVCVCKGARRRRGLSWRPRRRRAEGGSSQ